MNGKRTTEFWTMLIVTAGFFFFSYLLHESLPLIGAVIVPSVYIHSRTSVKNTDKSSNKIDAITVRK